MFKKLRNQGDFPAALAALALALLMLLPFAMPEAEAQRRVAGLGSKPSVDYPMWYMAPYDDLSAYYITIDTVTDIDTSVTFETKPGWPIYTEFNVVNANDSVDMYIILQTALTPNSWTRYDSIAVADTNTFAKRKWRVDTTAAYLFRFLIDPITGFEAADSTATQVHGIIVTREP